MLISWGTIKGLPRKGGGTVVNIDQSTNSLSLCRSAHSAKSRIFTTGAAYKGNFQRTAFPIPLDIWKKLNQCLVETNPGYAARLAQLDQEPVLREIVLEEELEQKLVDDLGLLKPRGYDLRLWSNPTTGEPGRQLVCTGNGGRIDLLCFDNKRNRYVVIELKNVRVGQNTFGQIMNYMGWVEKNIAGQQPVIGLVISRGYDEKFSSCQSRTKDLFHLDLSDIGFE